MPTEPLNAKQEHEEALEAMASKEFTDDLTALLKIRAPIVYLTTNEEKRMLNYFKHLAIAKAYRTFVWDCYMGLTGLVSEKKEKATTDDIREPLVILDKIIEQARLDEKNQSAMMSEGYKGNIYILLDFHRFLQDAEPDVERRLKQLSNMESMTTVVITGPHFESTPALENHMAVLDFPYPNEKEISQALWTLVNADSVKEKLPGLVKVVKKREDELLKAANGLTLNEAQTAFSKSVVIHRDFDIPTILQEKKQIIRKKGILEYCETNVSIDHVGGLKRMIKWFERRKLAFRSDARDYGLNPPRGALFIGMPGCGKSLTAKAVASMYEMPLLRLDFGRLFNSLVGESEKTARDAIKLAETIAPCILWVDEIEKGLSGARSSGQTDGGTTSRVISTFLTWMQEKTAPVFVVCTANDHMQIPPEFMRAGRFDEVFFIDLPTQAEREQIFAVLLKKFNRKPKDFDIKHLAAICDGYSGAEIEKSIEVALFEGFNDKKRKIKTEDIRDALNSFHPLSQMRSELFDEMRTWAAQNCVLANSSDENADVSLKSSKVNIDIS